MSVDSTTFGSANPNDSTGRTQTAAEGDATFRRVARRLIPLLVLCYFSAYIDRSNIGIAKLQFAHDVGLDEAMYGLGGGLFYLGYSLFGVPGNLLLERIGASRTFFRILVIWSLLSALMAFIRTPIHYYFLRLLIGTAESGFFPGVLLYLSLWIPSARRARFTAWFMSSMALSGIVGGLLSGFILHTMEGIGHLRGWQWIFILEGAPGVVLAFVTLRYLTDRPENAAWLTPAQRALIAAELKAERARAVAKPQRSLRAALTDRRFFAMAMMSAALIAGIGGIALWVPTLLRDAGIRHPSEVALVSTLPYLAGLVAQQWIARRSDRRQERRWHAALPALIAAGAWLLTLGASHLPLAAVLMICVATAGTFGATGPFWAMPATYLAGTAAAAGIAAVTTAGSIVAFLSPVVVGWASSRWPASTPAPIYYAVLLMLAAVTLLAATSDATAGKANRTSM
jgi:MFS family permease